MVEDLNPRPIQDLLAPRFCFWRLSLNSLNSLCPLTPPRFFLLSSRNRSRLGAQMPSGTWYKARRRDHEYGC
jgi:hypothetical protein